MNVRKSVIILFICSFVVGFVAGRYTTKKVAPEVNERFPEILTNFPVTERDITSIKIGIGSVQAHVGNPSFQLFVLVPKTEPWLPEKIQLINSNTNKAEKEFILFLSQYQKTCNMPDMIAYESELFKVSSEDSKQLGVDNFSSRYRTRMIYQDKEANRFFSTHEDLITCYQMME